MLVITVMKYAANIATYNLSSMWNILSTAVKWSWCWNERLDGLSYLLKCCQEYVQGIVLITSTSFKLWLIFSRLSIIGFTAHRSKSGLQYEDIASGSRLTDSLLVPGMCSMSSSTMSLSNLSSPNDSPLSMRSYYRRRSSAPSLTVSYLPALSIASQKFSYTVGCLPCTKRLRL